MKKVFFLAAMAASTVACSSNYSSSVKLNNIVDSVSYSLGLMEGSGVQSMIERNPFNNINAEALVSAYDVADNFSEEYRTFRFEQFDTISFVPFMHGFSHSALSKELQISEETANIILQGKFEMIRQAKLERQAIEAEANKAAGKAFLEENAKKEGVVSLASGVQYKVIEAGAGAKAGAGATVKVNYEGKLIDGTVFDSSYERNQPFTVRTNGGVIQGWQEVLQIMPAGAKWEVYIPSEMAYGDQDAGDKIKAGSTLIFIIEMLEITK